MKSQRLEPEFVETFPAVLQPGVLYISIEFTTCAHSCVCGCGEEVVTPLSPAQWQLTYNGRDVSLYPSVGNWSMPCQSHYVLDHGRIRWAAHFTRGQIATSRTRDRRALNDDLAASDLDVSADSAFSPGDVSHAAKASNNLWNRLRRWTHRGI